MRAARVAGVLVAIAGASACTSGVHVNGEPALVITFDHDRTGWPLRDAHVVGCERCHPAVGGDGRRIYTGADPACASCHADSHAGHLFQQRPCTTCHATAIATPAPDVRHRTFELGRHRALPCMTCHTQAIGAGLPDPVCHKCHTGDSPHASRFERFGPPACGACHVANGWDRIDFNHTLQTRFSLWPWHTKIGCRDCHRGDDPATFERFPRKVGCKGCHAHVRAHADEDHPNGRFTGRECVLCHPYPGGSIAR